MLTEDTEDHRTIGNTDKSESVFENLVHVQRERGRERGREGERERERECMHTEISKPKVQQKSLKLEGEQSGVLFLRKVRKLESRENKNHTLLSVKVLQQTLYKP